MGEKRKPVYTMLLKNHGNDKSNKLELFSGHDWGRSKRLFRIRVNGKWWPDKKFQLFYKSHIKNIVFNAIKI